MAALYLITADLDSVLGFYYWIASPPDQLHRSLEGLSRLTIPSTK